MTDFLDSDRVLLECQLEPVQGSRFQPTGFPSLGPAEFSSVSSDGKNIKSLLVESAQSMANRLEEVCVNSEKAGLVETLDGIPVITVNDEKGEFLTNSVLEAHRMNSSYMLEGKDTTLVDMLKKEMDMDGKESAVNIPKFAKFVFEHDTNSVLHGLFLAKSNLSGGRYKIARSLSSFIEATDIQSIVSGGVKLDHLDASGGDGGAEKGYGHIPYSKTEYSAGSIKVYFNIDLSLIRSYHLDELANELLFTLALWKIRSFLKTGLRLRTACDLKIKDELAATYPKGFTVPDLSDLDSDLKEIIKKCKSKGLFTKEQITIKYPRKAKK